MVDGMKFAFVLEDKHLVLQPASFCWGPCFVEGNLSGCRAILLGHMKDLAPSHFDFSVFTWAEIAYLQVVLAGDVWK